MKLNILIFDYFLFISKQIRIFVASIEHNNIPEL